MCLHWDSHIPVSFYIYLLGHRMAYLQKKLRGKFLILLTIYYWSNQEEKTKRVTQDRKQEESNSQTSNAKCVPQNINAQDVLWERKKVLLGEISWRNLAYYSQRILTVTISLVKALKSPLLKNLFNPFSLNITL